VPVLPALHRNHAALPHQSGHTMPPAADMTLLQCPVDAPAAVGPPAPLKLLFDLNQHAPVASGAPTLQVVAESVEGAARQLGQLALPSD